MKQTVGFFAILLAVLFVHASPGGDKINTPDKPSTPKPLEILSSYVKTARFNDFPVEVVNHAKFLILDNIGCALGGAQTTIGKKYLRMAANWKGIPESTLMGIGSRVSSMNAIYVNTQLANVLDFDDTYDVSSPAHPGNALVQTALSLGEAVEASGKDVLSAVILGYEVSIRIGEAEGPFLWQSGIFLDSITRGAATVASRLLKLNQEEICNALHHALELPSMPKREKYDLPSSFVVSETKNHFGLDALRGVLACRLAQQGVRLGPSMTDDDLKQWFLDGGDLVGYDKLTRGLGKLYKIMEMSFKPAPSCRMTHAPVTAVQVALKHKPIKAKDIEQIIIKNVNRLDRPEWKIIMEAQFSIQCVIALTALGIEPGPKWYITGKYNSPEVKELASKVKLENDPEAEEMELREGIERCTVIIKFRDGSVKQATINRTKGSPGNPMTGKELKAKFRANTIDLFTQAQVARIIDAVMNLEKLPRVSDLTRLLISPKLSIKKKH